MSQLTQPFSSRNPILALSLLHLRQRLLRLREQACAVHGRRDVSRPGDDGLEQYTYVSPLCVFGMFPPSPREQALAEAGGCRRKAWPRPSATTMMQFASIGWSRC